MKKEKIIAQGGSMREEMLVYTLGLQSFRTLVEAVDNAIKTAQYHLDYVIVDLQKFADRNNIQLTWNLFQAVQLIYACWGWNVQPVGQLTNSILKFSLRGSCAFYVAQSFGGESAVDKILRYPDLVRKFWVAPPEKPQRTARNRGKGSARPGTRRGRGRSSRPPTFNVSPQRSICGGCGAGIAYPQKECTHCGTGIVWEHRRVHTV